MINAQAGGTAFAYPPASLEKAVTGIFLAGAAGEAARQDKLALLLYLLADAGIADLEAFRRGQAACKGAESRCRRLRVQFHAIYAVIITFCIGLQVVLYHRPPGPSQGAEASRTLLGQHAHEVASLCSCPRDHYGQKQSLRAGLIPHALRSTQSLLPSTRPVGFFIYRRAIARRR